MYFRCQCTGKWQITEEPDCTVLERYCINTAESHKEDQSKYSTRCQIDVIEETVRCNPLMAPSTVCRSLKNLIKKGMLAPICPH